MPDHPRTPQTLPCEDEDPFFVVHEDASNVEVSYRKNNTAVPSSSHDFFFPISGETKGGYRHTVRKELEFEAFTLKHATNQTPISNDDVSTRTSRSLTVLESMKKKRKLYRNKSFSPSNLSNKIKTAIQSPARKKVNTKDKTRIYHSLEDEESPLLPDDFDDQSCTISLPSRIATSMSWKKRSSASSITSSTSASTTSLFPRTSRMKKWNKLIQIDSLATFKVSSLPLVPKATRAVAAMELVSTNSTESSCTSVGKQSLGSKAKHCVSPHLESRLKQGLYNTRVDEEDDEDSDEDSESDHHPEAGSFAYAIRKRGSLGERGSF